MTNLADLEIALIEEDPKGVSTFFAEVDRRTAAEAYRRAAKEFGFKTVGLGPDLYASAGESSRILGYADVSGLLKLAEGYGIYLPKMATFGVQVQKSIREALDLKPNDGRTALLPWEGFLLVGMYGRNAAAEKVKAYLLRMEREARIALELSTKESVTAELASVKRLDAVTKACLAASKMEGSPYHKTLSDEIARLTGRPLPAPKQGRLALVPSPPAED
jgi:hypothetical protein